MKAQQAPGLGTAKDTKPFVITLVPYKTCLRHTDCLNTCGLVMHVGLRSFCRVFMHYLLPYWGHSRRLGAPVPWLARSELLIASAVCLIARLSFCGDQQAGVEEFLCSLVNFVDTSISQLHKIQHQSAHESIPCALTALNDRNPTHQFCRSCIT